MFDVLVPGMLHEWVLVLYEETSNSYDDVECLKVTPQ
jgi:hypothetical protein